MTLLDNNVVNVAIPTIQRSLHLSESGIEWVVSAYILFFAGLLLAGGRLSDVFGRRRVFFAGLFIFTAASLAAGLAGSSNALIVARAIQGVGAALLAPTTLSIITHAYPAPKDQARAIGVWGAVGALSLAVGPVIGGFFAQHVSWKWIFFLNVPLGVLTTVVALVAVSAQRATVRRSLDVAGVATSAIALFALTFALIQGTRDGWTSRLIVSSFLVAVISALGFVAIERRVTDPMVDLRLFANRAFRSGLAVLMLWAFGLFGIYFFTALYLQNVLGFAPTKAGVAFVPMALLMATGATVSDRVAARFGPNRVLGFAMGLMAVGIASVSLLGPHATYLDLMPGFALIGVGGGLTMPLTSLVLSTMPKDRTGVASAIFNASRELAGLLGVTVIGVILTGREHQLLRSRATPVHAFLGGYRWGLLLAATLVALGGVSAFARLPRESHASAATIDVDRDEGTSTPALVS
ncbi:MAG: DHA2 family efflux MFS transporter permease subunit [Acidobacteriota bacterium]|nr:DHA2 family efflux MFS transporter permease subunit [Acidobacteriota bacterium]MDE3043561.1 DHA2 family efflux MFS transporter permease subunit [Acidobacteriota bacterium]MDE3106910.1 DHA2 family efflux MFS transporter permease subunit [Acidobacteriota bacterium]MDE3222567.1 DHA2 family efflux MFS transporter permease subunit [Acidobacteriota bacterium]